MKMMKKIKLKQNSSKKLQVKKCYFWKILKVFSEVKMKVDWAI